MINIANPIAVMNGNVHAIIRISYRILNMLEMVFKVSVSATKGPATTMSSKSVIASNRCSNKILLRPAPVGIFDFLDK